MSAPKFEHGTRDTYTFHACRCDECRRAQMRAVKAYRIATRADDRGRPRVHLTVDAAPAREHVAELRASGWTLAEIARELGVGPDAIWQNINPTKKRIRRERAAALLALQPLTPVDVDPVVVERLVASPDVIWRSIGATRQERIEAAERIPNRSEAERRLGLRAGRDFAVRGVA